MSHVHFLVHQTTSCKTRQIHETPFLRAIPGRLKDVTSISRPRLSPAPLVIRRTTRTPYTSIKNLNKSTHGNVAWGTWIQIRQVAGEPQFPAAAVDAPRVRWRRPHSILTTLNLWWRCPAWTRNPSCRPSFYWEVADVVWRTRVAGVTYCGRRGASSIKDEAWASVTCTTRPPVLYYFHRFLIIIDTLLKAALIPAAYNFPCNFSFTCVNEILKISEEDTNLN